MIRTRRLISDDLRSQLWGRGLSTGCCPHTEIFWLQGWQLLSLSLCICFASAEMCFSRIWLTVIFIPRHWLSSVGTHKSGGLLAETVLMTTFAPLFWRAGYSRFCSHDLLMLPILPATMWIFFLTPPTKNEHDLVSLMFAFQVWGRAIWNLRAVLNGIGSQDTEMLRLAIELSSRSFQSPSACVRHP